MHNTISAPPAKGLRDLFTEAAEHRRKGDLAAAHAAELLAMLAVRRIVADTCREMRA